LSYSKKAQSKKDAIDDVFKQDELLSITIYYYNILIKKDSSTSTCKKEKNAIIVLVVLLFRQTLTYTRPPGYTGGYTALLPWCSTAR
jgi:hypothetical protein